MNRDAFEKAVATHSSLSVQQIERLFGVLSNDNKAVIWRYLNMSRQQQQSVWSVYCVLHHHCPDMKVEAIK